ncbi:hypothetical protein [Bradyrhizobium sp.]|uniref:hypothetical protein n=1 Tax=Bradyrhizobium sp. TaxID=376 RepID=UPI0025BDC2E2|nr:hypothetical protein [Bradyrhizobium sp.]
MKELSNQTHWAGWPIDAGTLVVLTARTGREKQRVLKRSRAEGCAILEMYLPVETGPRRGKSSIAQGPRQDRCAAGIDLDQAGKFFRVIKQVMFEL